MLVAVLVAPAQAAGIGRGGDEAFLRQKGLDAEADGGVGCHAVSRQKAKAALLREALRRRLDEQAVAIDQDHAGMEVARGMHTGGLAAGS